MSNTTNPNIKSDKPPIGNDKTGTIAAETTTVVSKNATASKTSAPKETAWQHWFGSPHEVKPGLLHRAYAVPSIIIGLLFTLGPMCVIVAFSFMSRPDMGGGVKFQFSTDAYEKLLFRHDFFGNRFFDTRYLEVFGTSLWQALLTTVVCVALAFPIALWMSMKSAKTQQILVLLVTIPFWTNLLVRTYAWMLILNENGPINWAANLLGLGKQQLLYTSFASVIGLIYTFLPFAILPMYSALSGFDFRLVEAAYDLGARKLTVMRRVILRAAMPGVMSGVALCFIPAFGSYVQPVLLGGGRVLMVGNLIASQFAEARNWPFGAALSTVILAITLLGAFLATALGGRASRKAGMTL
ncbi:ABC transporter permease [Bifidobacterium callimiconis]|uniref:ABC transporter permease n=1 Tax=Bifidobacterium callimiconis TaxID=2306973 RepID=A0A430FGY0_9BIFI|nr:ABC transporter permease [Bifidobacterium callimiconis]RSX52070.1 ABC transporter permease [Bifidobacterium callimiconis]